MNVLAQFAFPFGFVVLMLALIAYTWPGKLRLLVAAVALAAIALSALKMTDDSESACHAKHGQLTHSGDCIIGAKVK